MDITLIFNILLYAFLFFATVQLFYFLFFYLRLIIKAKKSKFNPSENYSKPPVSVIIAARNEAENLKKNLPFFLEQDYPDFKVIVVNDASTDDSETILAEMSLKYKNLYVTNIPYDEKFKHGKKTALTVGIKAAETEILLFSDADCKPAGKNWISAMVRNFDEKTDFVIGFGAYETRKGLLNKLIRTDTVFIALQYLSFAVAGVPYMGVGRNMAYRKSVFMKNKGFASHFNLLSGSDDLFVNKYADKNNLKVELSQESFTFSIPETSFKQWRRQKIRHFTTGKYYKFKHKFLLGFELFSRIFFIATGIILLAFGQFLIIVSSTFALIFMIFLVILANVNKIFKQKRLLTVEPLWYIFQPLFNLIFYPFARKKKDLIWK